MTDVLHIKNGRVFDPANTPPEADGVRRDVYAVDGKIVGKLPEGARPTRTLDATACVVMPGGVDVHCHIASSTVNRARAMQGEEHASHIHPRKLEHNLRSGSGMLTPSTFVTGYRYAALGYTTALEAAVSPSGARQTHLELDDTPNLDAGFLLLCANHQHVIERLDKGDQEGAVAFISHMLRKTGALGVKVVNPGGVASWRRDATHHTLQTLDDQVASSSVTPRKLLQLMARVCESLNLPHPPHVHCNRLGLPGNVATTLETIKALEGRRMHLTHIQFHAYGQNNKGDFTSGTAQLCDTLNAQHHVSCDVGQVVFGDAFTLTGDTPLEHLLWKLTGRRYANVESELEAGCGVMPITYTDKSFLHSLQWSVGMELMLGCHDPWRVLLSTDHPNGGSFLAYPTIIAQLMNKTLRDEQLAKAHTRVQKHSALKDHTREFTLRDVAIVTRAGPARVLGLRHKGHLGPGADADITIYHDNPSDPLAMFSTPRYVIKAGQVLVDDGELRHAVKGQRLAATITPDEKGEALFTEYFRGGSYDVSQFGLHEHELKSCVSVKG
ncbi:MAG: formylmethanofuran dehydrogenase subunit A [Phycisphaera sp.]|nr:formylmethanofuran dehydrogenase subunit A [Phycisphaera sp.]